jgi:cellulose 1,4-beta-cellobiosidase
MLQEAFLAAVGLAGFVQAQQAGTQTAEKHPALPISQCTSSGCTTLNTEVTLDSNWRWLHTTSGYTNCYTGNKFDSSICTSGAACAKNCAVDGADYSGTYGIKASGNSLTLGFKTGTNVGSRTYLTDPTGNAYQMFKLKNKEFTFDVDVSKLPCGLNGALYFSEVGVVQTNYGHALTSSHDRCLPMVELLLLGPVTAQATVTLNAPETSSSSTAWYV